MRMWKEEKTKSICVYVFVDEFHHVLQMNEREWNESSKGKKQIAQTKQNK